MRERLTSGIILNSFNYAYNFEFISFFPVNDKLNNQASLNKQTVLGAKYKVIMVGGGNTLNTLFYVVLSFFQFIHFILLYLSGILVGIM